mmetsp:Transcript_36874/g.118235  ORF Transcript_36874/g.118235 Transcript_36874/m.118235 type:complete len:96 (-) Transcript_36874:144-431(-)
MIQKEEKKLQFCHPSLSLQHRQSASSEIISLFVFLAASFYESPPPRPAQPPYLFYTHAPTIASLLPHQPTTLKGRHHVFRHRHRIDHRTPHRLLV